MKCTIYETVTNTIIAALKRGVVPWKKPWSGEATLPCNAITQRAYRGVNVLLLSICPYSDPRWLTLEQIGEKGGRVKPCEKPVMVVFWKRWQPSTEDENSETVQRQVPLLRYFRVFNAEQCEELGLPKRYIQHEEDHKPIERAELLLKHMPNPPMIEEGSSPLYRPSTDVVQIPPIGNFKTPESYYATLFHELGHASGHAKRLSRPGVTEAHQFGSGAYSKEELVAELASAFCCASIALDNSLVDDAASYIDGWLKVLKSDPKAVVIAAAQAQRAADYIKGVTYDL